MSLAVTTADNKQVNLATETLSNTNMATVHHENPAQRDVLITSINAIPTALTSVNTSVVSVKTAVDAASANIVGTLTSSNLNVIVRGQTANVVVTFSNNSVVAAPSSDQDPIFDHTNAGIASVNSTSNTVLWTPPAGCKFVSMLSDNDVFIRTDANVASATANGSYKLLGSTRETIPVTANVGVFAVTANSSITASLRIMPYKVRP